MNFRTDLAIECREASQHPDDGITVEELDIGDVKISRINIFSEKGERELGRPKGNYITVSTPPLNNESCTDSEHFSAVKNELARLLPHDGAVLVCGIGNTEITPDAFGPKVASRILATRHISSELAAETGLGALRSVAAVSPGVLGQTGMEISEVISGLVKRINPAAVIAVDALASRRLNRLGCTVQLSDTGIIPGSGVGNSRSEISEKTLGIPVISVGVPTVVDAKTLVSDMSGSECRDSGAESMIVTPREIDMLIDRASRLVAHSINCALQPHLDPDDLLMLVG